jgi:signal transduction histidine kinase
MLDAEIRGHPMAASAQEGESVTSPHDARRARGAALQPHLHARLLAASRGLPSDDDLQGLLGHLLRTVGAGAGLVRLLLALPGDGGLEVRAAFPGPVVSLDDHARIADLVREVVASRSTLRVAAGPGRGSPSSSAMVAVPLVNDGDAVGALVGLGGGSDSLGEADEVALEAMTVLLMPRLLAERQLELARELDRLRSDFISRISHELRTPLTIINGFAGTLGAHEETLTAEQRHGMLDRIVTASLRLEHLVEEVLSLASVEAGLAEPKPVTVPVRDVVDLTVHNAQGADRVTVRGPESLKVRTDPDVARHVLGPVVENALQHGEKVLIEIEAAGDAVRIVVTDDGPGVPAELAALVFERFVRGDDRSPGMGLGLAIARRMGETIGARLWAEEASVGARFVVELPSLG